MATVTEPQALITDQTGLAIASAIAGNNTKVNKSDIAPDFSTDTIYNINDYVYYQSVLYRFTAPHAAGAWTGTDVEAVTIGEEIKNGTGKPDFTGTRSTWESMTVAERKTYKQAIFPNEYEDENITAAQVSFDNTSTGMTATNTQNAITELKSGLINVNTITNTCSFDVNSIRATFNAQSKVVSFDVRSNDGFTASTWTALLAITDTTLAPSVAMYFPVVFINANRDDVVGNGVGKLDTNNIISVCPDDTIPAYSEAVGIVMWQ